jgi:predicted MFS family arabinose efflux permease
LPKRPLDRIVSLSGLGIQIAVTIYAGAWLGNYLDEHYPLGERKVFTLILVLAATAVSVFNVLRQVNKSED